MGGDEKEIRVIRSFRDLNVYKLALEQARSADGWLTVAWRLDALDKEDGSLALRRPAIGSVVDQGRLSGGPSGAE